jgi:hypothetical protein
MRDFQFYLTDDRYGVPTLRMVEAATLDNACELAEAMLAETRRHSRVEVWEAGACVFVVGDEATASHADESRPPTGPDPSTGQPSPETA